MLNSWLLVNYHREFEEFALVCISTVGACTDKLKHLVEKLKEKNREF